jgi:hypothetical protein
VVEKNHFQTKKSFQMEFCDFYWVGWLDGWMDGKGKRLVVLTTV